MGDFHRPKAVGSENSPGVVTRAGVEAEGRNVGPSDAHHEGRIFWSHGPKARGIPIPDYLYKRPKNIIIPVAKKCENNWKLV